MENAFQMSVINALYKEYRQAEDSLPIYEPSQRAAEKAKATRKFNRLVRKIKSAGFEVDKVLAKLINK